MEISGMSSTFVLVVSEATTELLLMVISAVAWMYSEDIRKCVRKLLKTWNFRHGPMAADLTVKLPKCFENEDVESEGSSSEPEPEAEASPSRQMSPSPNKRPSPAVLNLPKPEIQNKINGSHVAIPTGLQPPPVLLRPPGLDPPPGLKPAGLQPQDAEKISKCKKGTSSGKTVPVRELGRCVCWKDSFGFIVDETGGRLFVRQGDLEGEEVLMAGQIVWFRRGSVPKGQTPKAGSVGVVDIEMAKILRAAEREGIKWSTFQKAVLDDDSELLASFKCLQNSANCKGKLTMFKAQAMKGTKDKTKGSQASPTAVCSEAAGSVTKAAMATAATSVDGDLQAFLGSGSVEQMRANLKYAPQWVTDKFNTQYGIAK